MLESHASESIKSISDFRFRRALLLTLLRPSSSLTVGHVGRTRVGSRSFAPRATILDNRCCCIILGTSWGTGGAAAWIEKRLVSS